MPGEQVIMRMVARPGGGWGHIVKDALDRVLALLAIIFAAPAMLIIAAAIKASSTGPVFYKQRRSGLDREPINVYKFRSMYMHLCDSSDVAEVKQATLHDRRVTPVGRLLRRTSLDEIPQLINVLKGEMSIVGPRPHAVAHDILYSRCIDSYIGRHSVKPGITGWAQVNGLRGETDTTEKMRVRVEYDLHYIKNWSLLLDFRIMILTARFGFVHAEAR